jgi:hypothetical protein
LPPLIKSWLPKASAKTPTRVEPSSPTDRLQHNYDRQNKEKQFVTECGTQDSYGCRTQQHDDEAYGEQDKFHVEPQSSD